MFLKDFSNNIGIEVSFGASFLVVNINISSIFWDILRQNEVKLEFSSLRELTNRKYGLPYVVATPIRKLFRVDIQNG